MKISDLNNIFTATFTDEDFTVCIVAEDEEDAKEIAKGYGKDAELSGNIEVKEFDMDDEFDCDYVLKEDDVPKEKSIERSDLIPKYDFNKPLATPDMSMCFDETYEPEEEEIEL